MIINEYEESPIENDDLPEAWRSQNSLDELEIFLQQNWEQRSVFYEDKTVDSRQQFIRFLPHRDIKTHNYIGTIVFRGEQLNIYPKVFGKYKGYRHTEKLSQEHLMHNLIRWLEYCTRISYPFISISTELSDAQNLKELFMTLYIGYVKSTIERGLYYQYVDDTEDISCIKGKFDIKDYLFCKVPNGQAEKFKCTYSTFEFDNLINRVIKYTCKLILNSTDSKNNQKAIRMILVRLNEVSDVQCKPSDCDKIRLNRLQSQYRVIMSMSKMFLLNKTSEYTMDNTESFCFLFPTELLFEGFIGGFMQEIVEEKGGKVHLQKSELNLIKDLKYGDQSLGSAFNLKMDIVVECKGKVFILDTKYKEVDRFEDNAGSIHKALDDISQGDVYQVCEYARVRGAEDVYLLYPMYRYENKEPIIPQGFSPGNEKKINIHFVRLPFIFEEDEGLMRKQLADVITDILDLE